MSLNIIEVRDCHVVFHLAGKDIHVLRGINLDVAAGEFVCIMGPSGGGKSTLLGVVGGLDIPTSGSIKIDGIEITNLTEDELAEVRNRKIGFVFQNFNLIPTLTALENIELPRNFGRGVGGREPRELLATVGLSDRLNNKPAELSGGEQQRVAIARALVNNPSLILADEPTGNLDSKTSENILQLMLRIRSKTSMTVVVVTHDPNVANKADRVLRLRDGLFVEE
jgi:putative ABC transport system ATP-binding protein